LKARSGTGIVLDSGDYPACLEAALEAADMRDFRARQAAARAEGRHLGIGLANYVKGTGRGPFEAATVRVSPSGRVSLITGATAIGQGTRTMLAQICADSLGVEPGSIEVVMGDTGAIAMGIGASASRQAVNAGSSALLAAREVADKLRTLAAGRLEAAPDDIELVDGSARVRGVAELSVGFAELANSVYGTPGYALPAGAAPGLEATAAVPFDALSYASGCHVAEVEADPETGRVTIIRYVVVHDSGRMINPRIVDGQVQGGVAHGLGNAILERIEFDREAQPLTTTLADYTIAGACDLPPIAILHLDSPTDHNPLGVKGVGESGTVPATAAVAAAVEDALAPFAVAVDEVPLRPDRLALSASD
ncbi:MAG: molybdopterin-dependent oxidoreductase, partial [Defluviicoccus sp.]|nr:molybdopterin-dependent oxidoreductase [Defluviicoccus sp.]